MDKSVWLSGWLLCARAPQLCEGDRCPRQSGQEDRKCRCGQDYIQKLYAIEKLARREGLSPPELGALSRDKDERILAEFKAWMDKRMALTPPRRGYWARR
jgi:hypothetical protein